MFMFRPSALSGTAVQFSVELFALWSSIHIPEDFNLIQFGLVLLQGTVMQASETCSASFNGVMSVRLSAWNDCAYSAEISWNLILYFPKFVLVNGNSIKSKQVWKVLYMKTNIYIYIWPIYIYIYIYFDHMSLSSS